MMSKFSWASPLYLTNMPIPTYMALHEAMGVENDEIEKSKKKMKSKR